MKVYGFVGPSGSGKSFRAQAVARDHDADLIIDDGLLISGNKVLAGMSAKKEKTRLASVRRALFFDDAHKEDVRGAILSYNPKGVLILGTSDAMVRKIAENLGLGDVDGFINIESVASGEEIEKAMLVRKEQGKHVIPVPTFEIKRDFSGYWMDTVRMWRRSPKTAQRVVEEKSVVRPTFSYLGDYKIANSVLVDICIHGAMSIPGVVEVSSVTVSNVDGGAHIKAELILKYGDRLVPVAKKARRAMCDAIEKYTSINVARADVVVKSLAL